MKEDRWNVLVGKEYSDRVAVGMPDMDLLFGNSCEDRPLVAVGNAVFVTKELLELCIGEASSGKLGEDFLACFGVFPDLAYRGDLEMPGIYGYVHF